MDGDQILETVQKLETFVAVVGGRSPDDCEAWIAGVNATLAARRPARPILGSELLI